MLRPRTYRPSCVDRVSAMGQSTRATTVYRSPDPVGVFAYGCLSGARCGPDQGVDRGYAPLSAPGGVFRGCGRLGRASIRACRLVLGGVLLKDPMATVFPMGSLRAQFRHCGEGT